jgi:hypothetical protein
MPDTSKEDAATRSANELLQDLFARSDHSQCFLLLDPTLRPVDTDEAPWQRYAEGPHHPVPIAHPNVDRAHYPVLTVLDPTVDIDASLLTHSIRDAFVELSHDSLQMGDGRRIGGWLAGNATPGDMALHLGKIMVQRHPSGHHVWLRLQDPAVLWHLWRWLQRVQRATLLGPVERFYLLNPAGELQCLSTNGQAPGSDLDLSTEQWAAIDCIESLNLALREWGEMHHPDQLRPACNTALAAIQRGKRLGFDDASDLASYGLCALAVHARFDFHPLLTTRLRMRKPGDYFGELVADLQPADWRRIAREAPAPGVS